MRPLSVLSVLLVTGLTSVFAQTSESTATMRGNFIERIASPPAQQDPATKEVVAMLATATVSTASAARFWAVTPPVGSLRADELPYVTGLFYVEAGTVRIDGILTIKRELVWEVRVVGGETRRLLWIFAKTGAVTQLFPVPSKG